jgi:formamidopyrimidine-DNA glycosylase
VPELPEVETVRSELARWLPGKTISAIKILHPRAVRRSIGPASHSLKNSGNVLIGAKILAVNRRGKFLWLTFNRPHALVIHLGMSGQVHLPKVSAATAISAHLRARIDFLNGKRELHFVDQRTFGYLSLEDLVADTHQKSRGNGSAALIPKSVAHIAPDLVEVFSGTVESTSLTTLNEKIRARKSEIKRVLLNQSVVSGIGNIYADEGLWGAKIHPESQAHELSKREVNTLLHALHEVMVRAIEVGGTSIDEQYKRVNGESGYFDIELNAYGSDGEPCPRCGTLIQRLRFMNRSSHLCPKCQKKR